jgi:hypothetical protein
LAPNLKLLYSPSGLWKVKNADMQIKTSNIMV